MRALLVMVFLLQACAQAPREEPSQLTPPPATEWLSKLRAAHSAADTASSTEARTSALEVLRALADEAAPSAVSSGDAAAMRRDLYGRAARLALALDRPVDAKGLIEAGLLLDGRDPFRSQLLVLSVETQRALGDEAAALEAERLARDELRTN